MTILDTIIAAKRNEVESNRSRTSIAALEAMPYFLRKTKSLAATISSGSGVIAEFKRKSPSKGYFNADAKSQDICPAYQRAGASALSILTDQEFFGGTLLDIEQVRDEIQIPILRKDFIIDEYQILEAKAHGADLILLIAAAHTPTACKKLASFARSQDLEVLLEVHDRAELELYLNDSVTLLGVNNRNLKTFETKIELSFDLAALIPNKFVKVAESGITSALEVKKLREAGYQGFLIGESFMKCENPGQQCADFIQGLR